MKQNEEIRMAVKRSLNNHLLSTQIFTAVSLDLLKATFFNFQKNYQAYEKEHYNTFFRNPSLVMVS